MLGFWFKTGLRLQKSTEEGGQIMEQGIKDINKLIANE